MAGKSTKATRSKYLQDIAKRVDKARELADALPRADGWGGGLHLPGGFGYGNLSDLLSDLGATIRDAAASAQSGQSSHATRKKSPSQSPVRHHATKKSAAQLDAEIDATLKHGYKSANLQWVSDADAGKLESQGKARRTGHKDRWLVLVVTQ